MHTADYIEHLGEIFVFRGGDGREYLNDLHALDVGRLERDGNSYIVRFDTLA